jgi:hypothetical protein
MLGIANKKLNNVLFENNVIGMHELSWPQFEEWDSPYENANTTVFFYGPSGMYGMNLSLTN